LTNDYREAGYILPDGRMLDFSGKKEGGQFGYRSYDHRDIWQVTGEGGTDGMHEFMRVTGSIRFGGHVGSIVMDLMYPPTPEQLQTILRASRGIEGFLLDVFDPATGSVLFSKGLDFPRIMDIQALMVKAFRNVPAERSEI